MNRIKHFKTKMSEEIVMAYLGMEKSKQNDIQIWKDFFFRFPELEVNNSEDHDFDLDRFAFTAAMIEISMETNQNYQQVGKKFLVVDNDEITLHLIREFFNPEYTSVFLTKNEKETLLFLENNRVDIVLIEVFMLDVDGFKLIEKIKLMNKGLPVIVQTVFTLKHEKEMCFAAGCDGYIAKPYLKEDFVKIVDFWLKKRPIINSFQPIIY